MIPSFLFAKRKQHKKMENNKNANVCATSLSTYKASENSNGV